MAASLKSHLDALNVHYGVDGVFSKLRLEEDTVSVRVQAGAVRGTVHLSLHERSSYPRTGALAFAEGSDELVAAVEDASEAIGESAALDGVLRLLGGKLAAAASGLDELLAGMPAAASAAASAGASGGSDEEMDDEDKMDDEDDEDDEDDDLDLDHDFERGAELENTLLRLRHQWELKDQKRREALGEEGAAEWAAAAAAAAPAPAGGKPEDMRAGGKQKKEAARTQKRGAHQIFNAAEATRMLCNELFELMKEEAEGFDGVSAQCVDYDIHLWRVQVRDLEPSSALAADMKQLKERYGYDTLELELQFTPDMHPFYPAWVKVVRPRFMEVAAEAAMSHPVMTLEGWDPMKPVKWLVRFVQSFLERHGRVALDDARNDPKLHAEGAYTSAEHCLCRLEILSSARPNWSVTHAPLFAARSADVDLDRIRTLNFGAKKKASAPAKGGWEAGVGYGHGSTEGPTWDISATEKAQAQQDREMRKLLALVIEYVEGDKLRAEVLAHSCVRSLMWQQLANGSLLDVGSRPERTSMYSSMLSLLSALGRKPELRAVVAQPTAQADSSGGRSVLDALESVRRQADFFVSKASGGGAGAAAATSSAAINLSSSAAGGAADGSAEGRDSDTLALAQRILQCARDVGKSDGAAARPPATPGGGAAGGGATPATAAAAPSPASGGSSGGRKTRATRASAVKDAEVANKQAEAAATASADATYVTEMQELQFDAVGALLGHHYESREGGKEAAGLHLPARTKRLALEAADMMGGALPASVSSTIWARLDEKRMHLWRAMISGPEGTPYSAGLFIFDIMCPAEYPSVAPKVNLQTTGGGSVRFNPNLYHCGKVCLSLLGTWQGDQGEQWHASTSTLLQVLMSIQALILVPDPYFNEPGYERTRNTPGGDKQSRMYNETIREGTIQHAMLDQIRKPPAELREAVLKHFALRRPAILAECRAWRDDANNSSAHATRLKALVAELEKALDALE